MDSVMFTLSISLRECVWSSKNRLIEYAHLITHNICFGWEITKLILHHTLLSGEQV